MWSRGCRKRFSDPRPWKQCNTLAKSLPLSHQPTRYEEEAEYSSTPARSTTPMLPFPPFPKPRRFAPNSTASKFVDLRETGRHAAGGKPYCSGYKALKVLVKIPHNVRRSFHFLLSRVQCSIVRTNKSLPKFQKVFLQKI